MECGWPTFKPKEDGSLVLCGIYGTRLVEYLTIRDFDEFDRGPAVFISHFQDAMQQLWTRYPACVRPAIPTPRRAAGAGRFRNAWKAVEAVMAIREISNQKVICPFSTRRISPETQDGTGHIDHRDGCPLGAKQIASVIYDTIVCRIADYGVVVGPAVGWRGLLVVRGLCGDITWTFGNQGTYVESPFRNL